MVNTRLILLLLKQCKDFMRRDVFHGEPAFEPEELHGNRFLVDFNLAYNPYCAYNEMWSCPITPAENRLKVPIRAGEKLFAHES